MRKSIKKLEYLITVCLEVISAINYCFHPTETLSIFYIEVNLLLTKMISSAILKNLNQISLKFQKVVFIAHRSLKNTIKLHQPHFYSNMAASTRKAKTDKNHSFLCILNCIISEEKPERGSPAKGNWPISIPTRQPPIEKPKQTEIIRF